MKKAKGKSAGTVYVTYCSGRKNRAKASMPSVRRYISPRIRLVHRLSRRDGARFAILSGEFGLLGPYEKIPYYDHLLQAGEVAALLPRVVLYLEKMGVRSVVFFHEPLQAQPQLKPYLAAIARACRRAGVRLLLSELAPARRRTGT